MLLNRETLFENELVCWFPAMKEYRDMLEELQSAISTDSSLVKK